MTQSIDTAASFQWQTDGLAVEFSSGPTAPVALVTLDSGEARIDLAQGVPFVEIGTVDRGHALAQSRLVQTAVGRELRYVSHEIDDGAGSSLLTIHQATSDGRLAATVRLRSFHGVPGVTSTVSVTNASIDDDLVLVSVPSFVAAFATVDASGALDAAIPDPLAGWTLLEGRSEWLAEGRWQTRSLRDARDPVLPQQYLGRESRSVLVRVSTSTWSTSGAMPLAALSSGAGAAGEADGAAGAAGTDGPAVLWQIEHNGPWRWEVGETAAAGYVALSGPTDVDHQWLEVLRPGESFTGVPVTVVLGAGLSSAVAGLTRHRRASHRSHPDHDSRPVIFNDYMNTLSGDPTTAALLPLIDAAADVGSEVFCIDAGWYDDSGAWWDGVGEWQPSHTRFPQGLGEVIDRIRVKGMTPGLWLEPEVIGVRSAVADRLPEAAFLQRKGKRVLEHGRYHLDLRHEAAVAHLDEVVDRLVREFGIGYFKLDYNIEPGSGTDLDAESVGAGLLGHNRAHLAWIDGVLDRHPTLVLENCASGAMRMDGAMLSRLQLQSTSDQEDFVRYPTIAAAAPLSMLPEQAANWAYPQPDMTPEEAAFCLTTSLLGRFYLSGHLDRMSEDQLVVVREAMAVARRLEPTIAQSVPEWPLGLPGWSDPWVALALRAPAETLVTLWKRPGDGDGEKRGDGSAIELALPALAGRSVRVTPVFPLGLPEWTTEWDQAAGALRVTAKTAAPSARVFSIRENSSSNG